MMSYEEYLTATGEKDSRSAWIWWKIQIWHMEEPAAIEAAYDPEWGWKPLRKDGTKGQ